MHCKVLPLRPVPFCRIDHFRPMCSIYPPESVPLNGEHCDYCLLTGFFYAPKNSQRTMECIRDHLYGMSLDGPMHSMATARFPFPRETYRGVPRPVSNHFSSCHSHRSHRWTKSAGVRVLWPVCSIPEMYRETIVANYWLLSFWNDHHLCRRSREHFPFRYRFYCSTTGRMSHQIDMVEVCFSPNVSTNWDSMNRRWPFFSLLCRHWISTEHSVWTWICDKCCCQIVWASTQWNRRPFENCLWTILMNAAISMDVLCTAARIRLDSPN